MNYSVNYLSYVKIGIVMNAGAVMINKINMVLAFMKLPIGVYW